MVEKVFWHIGLPKTGTTYLQQILWANPDALRRDGITLPGAGHRRHLWAALDLQERPTLLRRHPDAPGTWDRLAGQLERAGGAGLLTHEFFCGCTQQQIRRGLDRLRPASVEVIITARDAHGMLSAGWQEMVKNGGRRSLGEVAASRSTSEFSWQTWDLHGVLERWVAEVPPEHIHVIPMPAPGSPPDLLWQRFAEVVGLKGDYVLPDRPVNTSLGLAQVELLRRINPHLRDMNSAFDRGHWIRGRLAEGLLGRQSGDRFVADPELLEDCRARSRRAVELIRDRGVRVHGDLSTLSVPDDFPGRRTVGSATDAELLDAAAELVADMLAVIRDLESEQGQEPEAVTFRERMLRKLSSL